MQYVHLGRSGLKISRLCLGTMNFGAYTPEEEAFRIMDCAAEAGINIFDCADAYGMPASPDIEKGSGIAEEIIGKWLKKSGMRNEIIVSTKLYMPMGYGPNDRHLSALHIRQACDASLERLQTDHIDLYFMHHIDRETQWEEIWEAMEILCMQGKVIYFGSSNFAGWHIASAQTAAKRRNFMGLIVEESRYNLSNRAIEMELIPALRHYGLGLMPYSPLGGGLLAGALRREKNGRRNTTASHLKIASMRPRLEEYENLCADLGQSPAEIAMAWLLHNPAVSAPIVGPRTATQLTETLASEGVSLSDETLEKLNELWPGPRREAPEAYAW